MRCRHNVVHLLPLVLLLSLGCGKEEPQSPPEKKPADWCERVAAGPVGSKPGPVALSEAHALVRFFGTGPSYYEADAALASVLEGAQVDWDEAAIRYAEALQPVCALEATEQGLGPTRVEEVGAVAVIRRSVIPELLPGDTLVSIEGVPMADWLAPVYARTPSATPGYRFVRAMDELRRLQGPTRFGVRAPDGAPREVRVQPRPELAPRGTRSC